MMPGDVAGTLGADGYVRLEIDGVRLYAHVIAWAIMRGRWPRREVDHRDLSKSNNVWANLRAATKSQQRQNQSARRDSATGVKGIQQRGALWIARITVKGKRIYLGRHPSSDAAAEAYRLASLKHFGEFARAA